MDTITLHFKADNQQLTALDGLYKLASNTVDYVKAIFTLGENWTGFDVVRAVWYTDFECISTVLDGNGECFVPWEVLSRPEGVTLNLYGCDLEEESDGESVLIDRLTTYPVKAILVDVNARVCGSETKPVTPSQFEQYIAIVQELVGTVRDITSCVLNPDYTLTINYSDDTSDTVGPIRGEQGEQGPTGPAGNGISKIEKISTAGLVDTYRITFTNGTHKDYTVTNGAKGDTGNGIESIYLTGTSGAVKTYTILFTNGNTFEYQVTDGEVTLAQLEQVLPTDTASGAIASFPDGSDLFDYLSCIVDINPLQDLHGYDKPWVGGAGKNKLSNNYYEKSVTSRNGITYTVNDDGSVTLQGTSTVQGVSNWEMILSGSPSGLKAGTYIISADGLQNGVQIVFGGDVSSIPYNTVTYQNTSRQFTLSSDDATMGYCLIQVNGGATINTTIFPMIRLATETDATFAPYENICPIFAPTTSKNKIPYPYILGSNTVNGITYTDNGDGTLTINGTATASAFYDLGNVSRNYFELPAGTYTFAGSGNAGVGVTLCKIVNGSGQFFRNANTTAVTFTITETASYYFCVVVNSGTTVNNLIIKPQLEEGAVATPFRPYGENVQVKQIAKNLLDLQYRSYSAQQNVRYYRNGGGGVKLYAGKTYTLSVADDNTMPAGIYMNKYDPSAASHPSVAYRYKARSVTYTPSEDVVMEIDCYYATVPTEGIKNIKVQLEISDTATTYEPYNGQSYTTQLGQTVYGGTLDVVSGLLTVDRASLILDGTESWYSVTAGTGANRALSTDIPNPPTGGYSWDLLGNYIQPTGGAYSMPPLWTAEFNASGYLYVGVPTTITTVAEWKAYLASNPLQLVYELATPTTYQLTPTQIHALLGQNNVWADCGDVEVTYKADVQRWVEKMLNA